MKTDDTQLTATTRRPIAAAIAGLALVSIAVTGCGSDDETTSTTAAGSTATTVMTEDSTPATTATAGADDTATTAAAGGDAAAEGSGSEAVTPDGTAKMEIGPDWTDVGAQTGATAWQVGEIVDGFAPNVNLIGQPAPGISLDQYIELTKTQFEAANLTLIDSGTTTGSNGQELAYFEYSGDLGQGNLHFLGYVNIANDTSALATLTAPDPAFGEVVDQARPYLESVEVVQ